MTPATPPLAFLGTGLLGGALAEAALGRGDAVTVWNRTADKARALAPLGARVADTPADAVRGAARVHLVLRDDAAVEEVVAALRPGLAPGALVVDHTTTAPAPTAERAARLNADGVRYLHCPVFIGPALARQGGGTILASGPRALFDEAEPGLARMAARVAYLGERADLAAAYKLFGNALIIGLGATVADLLAVAAGSGVAPADALGVLQYLDLGGMVSGRGRQMAAGNFAPAFELTMARKDVALMQAAAGGRPLGALAGVAARMDALIAEGRGGEDFGVLAAGALGA
jgi:3-hydroxyisobutyrate dehydrogenase-like beta-hydroxyacid dehydrogenase